MEGWQVKEAFCPGVCELLRLAPHLMALQMALKPSQEYHLSHTSLCSPLAVPLAASDHLGESHGLSTGVTAISLYSSVQDLEVLVAATSDPQAAVRGCVFEEELGKKCLSGIVQRIAEKTLAVV